MLSKLISLVVIFLLFLFFTNTSFAQEKQISLVNPIRGADFWEYKHQILETPKAQYEQISKSNLSATWLVRYDALKDESVVNFLKSLNVKQEVGVFIEITPTLASDANVKYNESPNWHYPKSVFLTGYSPEDRIKLIDQTFKKYKEVLSKDPKSVGAWWIDAFSLNYMREKYRIEANLDVADQFSTDQYQVWGQYWSTPFYPSKKNALMPAQSKENKIGVVTTQWAVRDPFNGYGNGVTDSTYSVQANDYLLHDLGTDYFEKLLSIYPFVTVGLENDFSWSEFGGEYTKQIEVIARGQREGKVSVLTMADYASFYRNKYPNLSPDVLIFASDPLGGSGKVVWYQNLKYRLGWFFGPYGSAIRDLRIYNDSSEEDCFKIACDTLNMATNATKALDDVTFGSRWVIDEGRVSDVKVQNQNGEAQISYTNQAGNDRAIRMLENDIEVNGKIYTIPGAILEIYNPANQSKVSQVNEVDTSLDLGNTLLVQGVGLIKFIGFVVVFLLLPGWVITKRLILSAPVGIALFGIVSYVLGYLNLTYLVWSIPLVALVFIKKVGLPKIEKIKLEKSDLFGISVFLFGVVSWMLTTYKNGLPFNYGFGYWGPNGHDAIWHLGLIEQLKGALPPQNPIFAGVNLTNYHYLYDLLIARASVMFVIDPQDLLFRFFPLLFSILTGLLGYQLTKQIARRWDIKNPKLAAILAMFFIYFGGSLGWIISFLRNKTFGGESMFWSQQAISTQINPPFAISVVLLLSGILMLGTMGKNKTYQLWPIILLFGVLIGFKAYAGVLILGALCLFGVEKMIFRRDFRYVAIFIGTFLLSLLVFLPSNSGSNSLFVLSPFWLVKSMIESPDRLFWERFNLTLDSGVFYKVIPGYLLAILIFLVGNLGWKFFGLGVFKRLLKERVIFWIIVLGFAASMLFVQKGNSWNVVQFFYYSSLLISIFVGIFIAKLSQVLPKAVFYVLLLLVIITTIPTSWDTLTHYTPVRPSSYLPKDEINALNFLKMQPSGIVLSFDGSEKDKEKFGAPYPLFIYTSTAYIPAFSSQNAFVADIINLEILGVDYKGRLNVRKDFITSDNKAKELLEKEKIRYIYIPNALGFQPDEGQMGIKRIFENNSVDIYRVF